MRRSDRRRLDAISPAATRLLMAILSHPGPGAPSIRELCDATGVRSTSTITHQLHTLLAHGLVDWEPGQCRTLHATVEVVAVAR